MFCRIGVKFCHFLRVLMDVLVTWIEEIDVLHDRIYCSCCEPTYIHMTNFPPKGDLNNEQEC